MKIPAVSILLVLFLASSPSSPAAQDAAPKTDTDRAEAGFAGMDADRSGAVSFAEFHRRFPRMPRAAFDAIDANRDGEIDREEWRAFSTTHGGAGRMPPPDRGAGGAAPERGFLITPPPDK
jgi:hypothetical protein